MGIKSNATPYTTSVIVGELYNNLSFLQKDSFLLVDSLLFLPPLHRILQLRSPPLGVVPVDGYRRIHHLLIGFVHEPADDLWRDATTLTTEGRDDYGFDVVFKSDHESGAHALINDHGVLDREWNAHGGGMDELHVIGTDVDDEA